MINLGMDSEICNLKYEEERVLACFTRHLIEIAAAARARGSNSSPTAALNAMCLPAVAIDRNGFVVDVTSAAGAVFDNDIKIKDRRLVIRDPAARAHLKDAILQLRKPRLIPLALKPFIVPRRDKLSLILRIWPFAGPASEQIRLTASPVYTILSVYPVLDAPSPLYYN